MRIIPSSRAIPTDFSYRRATSGDRDEIVALVYSALKEFGLVPEPKGVDADLENVESSYSDGYFGVIEHNGKIVTTYALFHIDNSVAEIRKMYAKPEVRGKGLGRWMVNHLIEIAKHNDYRTIELETASPLVDAIALYKKLGFTEKDFEHKTPRCDKSFYMNI